MPATTPPTLVLTVRPGTLSRLSTLLQRGFLVPCSGPLPLQDFLLGLPGFNQQYIASRIETIFINGCAADSLEEILQPGNTVALSAAMPGLAGAIFRKGGAHASLRSKPVSSRPVQSTSDGFITLKLFNMIATETVEMLLPHGILIKGSVLTRFFHRQQERLRTLLVDIRHDASSPSLEEARLFVQSHAVIRLVVREVPVES